jgi:tellurite resistance protein TerC
MLDVTPAAWATTIGAVVLLFAIDLLVLGRRPRILSVREAVTWSVSYISCALLFGVIVSLLAGWRYGGEYFAGYIVELSLSIDNLFVFVVIMTTFAVPEEHQPRVLTVGIILALVLRAIFIALGAALLAAFSFMFLIFGLILAVTAVQLFRHRNQDPSIEDNALVNFTRRRLPFTDRYEGGKLFTRIDGRRVATPLFLVLVAIGSTDILFALDSIPAVFGVTQEAFIVFAANAFALLGLRALFFLVSGLLDRLVYLSTGLSVILGFIGIKLVLHWGHLQDDAVPEISTPVSLVVIVVILTITTIASLLKARRDPTARAHSGTLREPREAPATR